MKRTEKITLTSLLIAIFLSGYGVGFLLGEKKIRKLQSSPQSWVQKSLETLTTELNLTDAQQKDLLPALTAIHGNFVEQQRQARNISLKSLAEKIPAHLNDEQQKLLTQNPAILQKISP